MDRARRVAQRANLSKVNHHYNHMDQIKTVADLKRAIVPGVRLCCTIIKGASKSWESSGKREEWKNRAVTVVDTTGFYLKADAPHDTTGTKRGSFCQWPKAAEFEGGAGMFTITNGAGTPYEMVRVYNIIK